MKSIFVGIFFLLLIQLTSFGQETILLKDDFTDNKMGWRQRKDSNFRVTVKDGVLHLEKFQKNFTSRGCLWYSKTIQGLNTLNNFSVIFSAKFLSGGDIFEEIDFQWGDMKRDVNGNSKANLYQVNFFLQGEVRLDHFNSKWDYFPKRSIKHLLGNNFDPHQINKYELIQRDGFIYFQINGVEVLKQKGDPVPGNSIGFLQCLKSAWEIDKIEIRQQLQMYL